MIRGVIGFILWNKNKKPLKITKAGVNERITYLFVIFIGTIGGWVILKNTNDPLPFLDAFTTVSSLVATYYMVNKKVDAWIIWFINDIFYAIEYFILPEQAFYLFILNVIWAFMAVASYLNWKKLMKEGK